MSPVPVQVSPSSLTRPGLEAMRTAVGGPEESAFRQSELTAEDQFAVVRLGIATSLYYALRTKNPTTAAHSLRVALYCSSWAERLGLDSDLRDRIEVAALLHDIGKIGIPDRILRKPGKLTVDEQLSMDACPELGAAILQGCTNDADLLAIVRYGNCWFKSRRQDDKPKGEEIPLGARMLAIADAFDAMTTEHIYRPALSRDRAIIELVGSSGVQFDPTLVVDFTRMVEEQPELLQGSTVHRWLQQLRPDASEAFWTGGENAIAARAAKPKAVIRVESRFKSQLLRTLKDGVVFTDTEGVVTQWNLAMERMTGVLSEAMVGKQWSISAVSMRDADGDEDHETQCPLSECVETGISVRRAMVIENGMYSIPVHVEVAPVVGEERGSYGCVIVVHDLSDRENLERRLESLHQETILDPLTRVANRAHFDQTLKDLVKSASSGGNTFALIICDIDKFKRINDTFGHPAGDDALMTFAELLRSHSREGDLVARYGGEEFLLLADACDNSTGIRRAEAIRAALESTRIPSLNDECMTASFGVTEYQSGDTAATVVARADRALLKAKDNGRNRVVQLGLGKKSETPEPDEKASWFSSWFSGTESGSDSVIEIFTPVPIDLAIEKLRGFIADHEAEIVSVSESKLSLKVNAGQTQEGRRKLDRRIAFHATITLSVPDQEECLGRTKGAPDQNTKASIELRPIRNRDRRNRELKDAVKLLAASFRSYLMGEIITSE
ncbi:MAG: diguanylate cyclase [Planctomycetota bacterium]